MLPSDTEDAELTESELESEDGTEGDAASVGVSATTGSEAESESDGTYTEDEEEDDWVPSAGKTPRAKPAPQRIASPSPAPRVQASTPRVSKLERGMSHLTLGGGDPDDSVIILPVKNFRARQESSEYEDREEPGVIKKKKRWAFSSFLTHELIPTHRQLGKKPVMTEEQIERAAAKQDTGKNVRRMTGRF
jgi:kinesin family protein 20